MFLPPFIDDTVTAGWTDGSPAITSSIKKNCHFLRPVPVFECPSTIWLYLSKTVHFWITASDQQSRYKSQTVDTTYHLHGMVS